MKNLTITLSLILTLASSQVVLANVSETPSHPASNIETVIVVAQPEVANFEIFSEKHSARAIEEMNSIVASNLENQNDDDAAISTEI